MKNPVKKNEEASRSRLEERTNFKIYTAMVSLQETIVDDVLRKMMSEENKNFFNTYQNLGRDILRNRVETMVELLEVAIRIGDRMHFLHYADSLAKERLSEGFYADEVVYAVVRLVFPREGRDEILAVLRHNPVLIGRDLVVFFGQ